VTPTATRLPLLINFQNHRYIGRISQLLRARAGPELNALPDILQNPFVVATLYRITGIDSKYGMPQLQDTGYTTLLRPEVSILTLRGRNVLTITFLRTLTAS
jgi:hypothetical protein